MINEIKQLAEELNIHPNDVQSFAQSIVNSIVKDGAQETFMSADQESMIKMMQTYAVRAVEKMKAFRAAYLSQPEVRAEFEKQCYLQLTQEAKA